MYMYCIAIGILNRVFVVRYTFGEAKGLAQEGQRPPSAPPPKQLEEFFVMKV